MTTTNVSARFLRDAACIIPATWSTCTHQNELIESLVYSTAPAPTPSTTQTIPHTPALPIPNVRSLALFDVVVVATTPVAIDVSIVPLAMYGGLVAVDRTSPPLRRLACQLLVQTEPRVRGDGCKPQC